MPLTPIFTAGRNTRLLRYRFDSVDQVARHFHLTGGRVILYYPTTLQLEPGERVLLDACFANSEQHCPVRGAVLSCEAALHYRGAWLEFAAYGLVSSLQSASASPKRRQRRYATDLVINVERGEAMPVVARLADVGLSGARLSGVSMRAAAGDRVRLSLFSRDRSPASIVTRVAWSRGSELGVEFKLPSPSERAAIASLVDGARSASAAAPEAHHPAICPCSAGGAVVEPPLPRSIYRQTGSGRL